MTTATPPWNVEGSYYEVCSCDAICPCRQVGGRAGGRSTYGVCDFGLSWQIEHGRFGDVDLSGLAAVMVGRYSDDEPRSPWRIILYVDERADQSQCEALSDIFLGRVGGGTFRNFARAIGEVHAVRRAQITLDHTPGREAMKAGPYVSARTARLAASDEPVTCGIPGHDRSGQEIVAERFRVADEAMQAEFEGRCGFAVNFAYDSDQ